MGKNYYLATNYYGCGRSLEPENGWQIRAYNSKAERDNAYDLCDYSKTGCLKIASKDVPKVMGTKWFVSRSFYNENESGIVTT